VTLTTNRLADLRRQSALDGLLTKRPVYFLQPPIPLLMGAVTTVPHPH
jgi:hypothetical protein